jgi:predicted nucleic acid-binding protein
VNVLVDSSVWIEYFRGTGFLGVVDSLIENNLVVINDLILAELIPPLHLRKQKRLVSLLREVKRYPISVDWDDVIRMQTTCLRNGINRVGIPDLIIAQNAVQNHLYLLAHDKHFALMSDHIPLSIYGG